MHPTAAQIEQKRIELERNIGFDSLYRFVRMAWHVVEPRPFEPNWHIEEECAHLEAISAGKCRFLCVNQPPGTSKSIIISVLWPVWDQLRNPTLRVANASFDKALALRDSGKSLKLFQSEWFKARWGDKIAVVGANPAEGDYEFVQGGCRFATSVAGAITGRHFDRIIVDDPVKPLSTTIDGKALENAQAWWEGTLPSRIAPNTGCLILVMQRLHENDLTGVALAEKDRGWVHLRFPMRFEADDPCRTPFGGDRRTEAGSLLWPSRFPETEVALFEKRGSRYFASQYQQRPVPKGGAVFKSEWFRAWVPVGVVLPPVPGEAPARALPSKYSMQVISVDCAFKDLDSSDFVAMQVWGKSGPDYYLLDQVHDQLAFTDTLRHLLALRRKWPRAWTILIEDKANGSAVIDSLKKTHGISGVVDVNPEGGKMARAQAVAPQMEAGNVIFPHPDVHQWADGVRDEFAMFPAAKHDDQVDAATQFLNWALSKTSNLADAMDKLRKSGGRLFR